MEAPDELALCLPGDRCLLHPLPQLCEMARLELGEMAGREEAPDRQGWKKSIETLAERREVRDTAIGIKAPDESLRILRVPSWKMLISLHVPVWSAFRCAFCLWSEELARGSNYLPQVLQSVTPARREMAPGNGSSKWLHECMASPWWGLLCVHVWRGLLPGATCLHYLVTGKLLCLPRYWSFCGALPCSHCSY